MIPVADPAGRESRRPDLGVFFRRAPTAVVQRPTSRPSVIVPDVQGDALLDEAQQSSDRLGVVRDQ